MPSRQDQLHSYQFAQQRVVAALVTHDADPQRSPLRRAGTAVLASALIAALAAGAAGVHGLLTGHSSAEPTDTHVILVEKGSGARYVYLESDRRLHPVLNYTSGLLLAEGAGPPLRSISATRLGKVPLGAPLGIPDAPDSLPAARDLLRGAWTVCTESGSSGRPRSTLLVGEAPADGRVAAAGGQALLVRDTAGRTFLVYGNRRFQVPAGRVEAVRRSLGWFDRLPWPVATAWADAVPAGPDLRPPSVPGTGRPSALPGYRIGDVMSVGGRPVAVVLRDGISGVTPLQAGLLAAEPGARPTVALDSADYQRLPGARPLADAGDPGGLPATAPALADDPARACVSLPPDDRSEAGVRLDPTVPRGTAVTGGRVDAVHVARGRGAVVAVAASPDAPPGSGAVGVVTDDGRHHPLAGRELLAKLGYAEVTPQPVPGHLVGLLPEGPALDPARALRP